MPRSLFTFDSPDRFVVGTVGQPGDRTFYLQASGGGQVVSVALEKTQVAILADRLEELLAEISRRAGADDVIAALEPDVAPLDSPVEEQFRVGAMGLAWDGDVNQVVVEAQAVTEEPVDEATILEDVDEGPDALRVRMSTAAAQAFIERARRVISAGRPPCPLCGMPLDPESHICPRQNGYRR